MPDHSEAAPNRDDLVARLDLMQAMIAEGRATTARFGWIFVMWGLIYSIAMTWTAFLPHRNWAWPICITFGVVASITVRHRQRRAGANFGNPRERSIASIWRAMGTGVTLFSIACAASHQITGPVYISAVLFMVGTAHATSAMTLRWAEQGMAAAVWWVAGIGSLFFTTPEQLFVIYMLATFFGMILFGIYAMVRERKRTLPPAVPRHA
ncbi:MAG TPA: hypothetical protein VN612_12755 [Acidobacteriaceae bacterium]|nr:hypothetical protein [Acidobacteriaceae bacterium]